MTIETQQVDIINRLVKRELGQARPGNTTAVSLYSPAANITATIDTVVVCNTSGASASFRLFLDHDGTTYNQTTALIYDLVVLADSTTIVNGPIYMNLSTGNLAVRTDTGNALTFTAYGIEMN